jgi:TPP-dependent pyruvate/acetoin dehydrogenase alpha subunit
MQFDKDDIVKMYMQMYELRQCDERLARLKLKDLVMNGFHPYVGEEAVAVGVCFNLLKNDYMVSTHRPQGHAIAKGGSVRSIFCEMLGRMGGSSNGLGGPMQWVDADNRFFCGSIVGSGICLANGFALTLKQTNTNNICVCVFGDGASNTGSFHEGMNLAAIWKLPVIFICENNQYGEAMPVKEFVSVDRISKRAASYGYEGQMVDGMNVRAVAEVMADAIDRVRKGQGPCFIEAVTYRYKGHYMGDPDNYRTKEEITKWRKKDPLDRCRKELIDEFGVSETDVKKIEQEIEKKSDEDQAWALKQPKPTLEFAVSNVLIPVAGRRA